MSVIDRPAALNDLPTEQGGPTAEACSFCDGPLHPARPFVFWSYPRLSLHPKCAQRWAAALHADATEARMLVMLRRRFGEAV